MPRPHDPSSILPPQGIETHAPPLRLSEDLRRLQQSLQLLQHHRAYAGRSRAGLSASHAQAERLVAAGVEGFSSSQDTSAYGLHDLHYAKSQWRGQAHDTRFITLAEALGSLGAWVRLHYVYPYPHVDQVLPLMAEGRVLPYLDIPFQHASPKVLKAMRRPAHQEKTLERLGRWREICPELAIRSTFIVGFPGETEDDFMLLLDWPRRGAAHPRRLLQI